MSDNTRQYADFVQQSQEAVHKAVDSWTRTFTSAVGQLPTLAPYGDVESAVDRYFDLNESLLAAQRRFAKQLVGYATTAGAAAREYAEPGVEVGQPTEAEVGQPTEA